MTETPHNLTACPGEDIAAYLDGELDAPASERFEAHVKVCAFCAERLREQRMLLCELDFLLGDEPALALPQNFTELVTVRAQADLSGVRDRAEHKRAARLCVILGLLAFAFLGGAWREAVWQPLRQLFHLIGTLADFIGHALYDTGAGFAVLSRNVGGYLLFQSGWLSLLVVIALLLALVWLNRLISDYHRTRSTE